MVISGDTWINDNLAPRALLLKSKQRVDIADLNVVQMLYFHLPSMLNFYLQSGNRLSCHKELILKTFKKPFHNFSLMLSIIPEHIYHIIINFLHKL